MTLLPSRLLALLPALPLLCGCQFFFPTPIDQHAATLEPSQTVRAVGASYVEGEKIEVELSLDGVVAGKGSLSAGKRCLADGRTVLPIKAQGGSSGFLAVFADADADTFGLIDLDNNAPFESRWDITVGEKRTLLEMDYEAGGYRAHQLREEPEKKPKNIYRKVELPTEQVPHDGHSLLGYLRRWRPEPGTRGHLYVTMGRNLYRAELIFVGPDAINTRAGSVSAFRIDGTASRINEKTLKPTGRGNRPFSLWVADDESHTPLRILVETEVTKISLDLVKRTVTPVAAGDLAPCTDRVDKQQLAKAKSKKKKAKDAAPSATAGKEASPSPKPGAQKGSPGAQRIDPELVKKLKLRIFPKKSEDSDDD